MAEKTEHRATQRVPPPPHSAPAGLSHKRTTLSQGKRKQGNVLFNHALNTFYLQLYGEREMIYLMTHSTHFIYSYMASDIW